MLTKNKVIFTVLTVVDLVYIALLLLVCKNNYLYSKFVFDIEVLFFNLIGLVLLNAAVILIGLFAKRIRTLVCTSVVFILPALWILVTVFLLSAGMFWVSETNDYADFDNVDASLDRHLEIAGLKISDIMAADAESDEEFYYYYQSRLLGEHFALKAELHLAEQDYEIIKGAFEKAKEFKANTYTFEQQQELNMTGYYEFDSQVPMSESLTSVDHWERVIINFCDERNVFFLDLKGECET